MTHEEKAVHLLRGLDLASSDYCYLVKNIAEALQEAFDLGWCAAGGNIPLKIMKATALLARESSERVLDDAKIDPAMLRKPTTI